MFRVSVAFPLAKMCQLVYYCVSACSFVQKFCGFQSLVSLFNVKYNIPNKGDETRLRELSLFFLYLEASNPNRFYFFLLCMYTNIRRLNQRLCLSTENGRKCLDNRRLLFESKDKQN